MSTDFAVVLIGLGRAGATYPPAQSAAAGPVLRNHLSALRATDGFRIAAVVDPDKEARQVALDCFDAESAPSAAARLEELEGESFSLAVLADPPTLRSETVRRLLATGCRMIIIEKPLARTLEEAADIVELTRAEGVTLRINFNRRFDPAVAGFLATLPETPIHISAVYGKGLENYGSHLIDLVTSQFGRVQSVQGFGQGIGESGRDAADPSVGFRLDWASGLTLVADGIDGIGYDQFEINFHCRDQLLSLINGGAEKRRRQAVGDLYYPGYAQLGDSELIEPPMPIGGYREIYAAALQHLREGAPMPGCTGDDAYHGMKVVAAIRESLKRDGAIVKVKE